MGGLVSIIMASLSAFCYTTIATVKARLLWAPVIPEHPDMELMLETILVNAEPFMAFIAIYFAAQFSFSRFAQYLGSKSWFRGISWVPCILTFIGALLNISFCHSLYWIHPIFAFIVNPVTVFMLIVGIRFLKELAKRKEDRAGWKGLFEI